MNLLYLKMNLIYIALFLAVPATVINLVAFRRLKNQGTGFLNALLSALMAGALASTLLRLRSSAICYKTPQQVILLYGGVILLQCTLFRSGIRTLRGKE